VTWQIAVAVFGLFVTIIGGFAGTLRAIGRVEMKMELLWAWYLRETSTQKAGGRRYSDPPSRWEAHDSGEPDGS
jgi:hypothetical protein